MAQLPLPDGYIDLNARKIVRGSTVHSLTANEAKLVTHLAAKPGVYFSAESLIRDAWGYKSDASAPAVKVAVHRLRRKIEPNPEQPQVLLTSRNAGFSWRPAEPSQKTAYKQILYGRRDLLFRIRHALTEHRLVTLVGPGGIGKTALARAVLESTTTTKSWIDLSEIPDVSTLESTIRAKLGGLSQEKLEHILATQSETLLVLDNLEHLLPTAAPVLHRWLTLAPQIRLLATSRKRVELTSEAVIDVDWLSPEASEEMFIATCEAAGSPVPNDHAELLAQLQGWPLAILHAGSLLRSFSTKTVADALLERNSPSLADLPPQQRSLNLMLQKSWKLLSSPARALLLGIALIPGTIRDADIHLLETEPLSTVLELLQNGWLQRQSGGYTLHPLIRDFVQQALDLDHCRERAIDQLLEQLDHRVSAAAPGDASLLLEAERIVALSRVASKHPRMADLLMSQALRASLRELGFVEQWLQAVYASVSDPAKILEAEARAAYQWATWEPERSTPLLRKVLASFHSGLPSESRQSITTSIAFSLMSHDRRHGVWIADPQAWLDLADAEIGPPTPENEVNSFPIQLARCAYAGDRLDPEAFDLAFHKARASCTPGSGFEASLLRLQWEAALQKADLPELDRCWNLVWAAAKNHPQRWTEVRAVSVLYLVAIVVNQTYLLRSADRELPNLRIPRWYQPEVSLHRAMAYSWFHEKQSAVAIQEMEALSDRFCFREQGLVDWARGMANRESHPEIAIDRLESSIQRLGDTLGHFRVIAMVELAKLTSKERSTWLSRADALLVKAPAHHPIRLLRNAMG